MKPRHLFTIITAVALGCLTGFAAAATAADPVDPTRPTPTPPNATGVWKWTTEGRNGQPEESVLKLAAGEKGSFTGTLTDRSGTHPLANVSVNGNRVEFTLLRDTPNGKVPIEHSLKLDGPAPRVTIERPDFAPAARKAGKKRKAEVNVVREKEEKAPKN